MSTNKEHSMMKKIGVVGLGIVGLPLAVEFGKQYETTGYDLSEFKLAHYRDHIDPAGEVSTENLKAAVKLEFARDPTRLADFDYVIVPTPVDEAHVPELTPLTLASETVGANLKHSATVVYESTVYPGATEEVCIPILERASGLKWQEDFHVGYSPERVNPGYTERTITTVTKVVAGDSPETTRRLVDLYGFVVEAGILRCLRFRSQRRQRSSKTPGVI